MAKKAKKTTAKRVRGPAYNLPEPNDDLAAYGWHMNRLRYPAETEDKKDLWPGRSIFSVPEAEEFRREYGIDVNFVCPAYLQFILDRSPDMQTAVAEVSAKKYDEQSLKNLREAVAKSIAKVLVPHMKKCLEDVTDYIAGYYASKMAYIERYGAADADAED